MPKVGKKSNLNRAARRVAATNPLPTPLTEQEIKATASTPGASTNESHEGNTPAGQTLSRGQRKRQAKREQYLKKEKMILSTLVLQKQEEQKRRIDGLDALRDALLETTKESESKEKESKNDHQPTYSTNRAKKNLAGNEIERINLVMQHPVFQENPFGAIQEHLRNTLASEKEKRKQEGILNAQQKKEKKEAKKQEKKERLRGVKRSTKKYKPRRSR